MVLPPDFIDLPIVLLGSSELNLFLLQRQLHVILRLHETKLILLLAGLRVRHIYLLDQLLRFNLVQVDLVHLIFQLLHKSFVGGL